MDIVLGVSMSPETVRLLVIEGQGAHGVTVDQDEFEVAPAGSPATPAAVEQVIGAIRGTRESAREGGHRLVSTGVTWTDPAAVGALRDALASQDLGGVMLVAPLLAAAALAQTVGQSIGYEHIAMLFVERQSATMAVVDVYDGSIVDLHRHQLAHTAPGDVSAELAAMVAGLDAPRSRADGVFLIGCGTDIVPLKRALEAATSLEVTAPEEPDMAMARGAAQASANAPLFASSTAALAYALDPGTGEVNPRALTPSYLDVSGNAEPAALAYSAVEDEYVPAPRRRRPMVLAGSALAAIFAVVVGVVAVSLTSDGPTSAVRHNPRVSVATPAQQAPAQAPPPAQAPAPSPASALPPPAPAPAPPPLPTAQAAAPPPPPAPEPAPQPTVAPPAAAPVHRAPPARAPEYVPTPVQQAAPAPAPAAPPPSPPVAAPAPPPVAAPAPAPAAPEVPRQPPMTMYLHFPFVTVPIPITPPAPPPPPPPAS
ncbi:MAG: DUF7159 family protein [Mycobacterium sp.]